MRSPLRFLLPVLIFGALILSCGDDSTETEADRLGVGAACSANADCQEAQSCLTEFKGGYCGLADCVSDKDCPEPSACVTHDDGKNYCFRTCGTKDDCNANRSSDNEANCSSSVTFTEADANKQTKACIPPSG